MEKLVVRYIFETNEERREGLMYKAPLAQNECALFVWDYLTIGYMWNKNVSFPIDVGFFSENKKLMNVEHLKAYQESPVFAAGRFKYVLETSYGWFNSNHIFSQTPLNTLIEISSKKLLTI